MTTQATEADTRALVEDLRRQISGEVRFDKMTRMLYSTDASMYQIEPIGVVIPRTSEDVIAVVEMANRYNVPVLPRGGGTSLAGQTVGHAIVMDFSKYMRNVIEVTELLADRQQPALGPREHRQVVPLGTAHGTQQYGAAAPTPFHHVVV